MKKHINRYRNSKSYIAFTTYLSNFHINEKKRILNYLIFHQNNLNLSILDECFDITKALNLKNENNLIELINILKLAKIPTQLSGVHYYQILLDSCTNPIERIQIKKRHKIAWFFINNINEDLVKIDFLKNLSKNLKNLKSYVKKYIEKLDITDNPISDLDNATIMFEELIKYPLRQEIFSKIIHNTAYSIEKNDLELSEFMTSLKIKLSHIYDDAVIGSIYKHLIANKHNLENLLDKDFMHLDTLIGLNNKSSIEKLQKLINEFETRKLKSHKTGILIEDNLKNLSSKLPIITFHKGGGKNKDIDYFNRNDIYYIQLETIEKDITYSFIQEFSKRHSYFEYFHNKYSGTTSSTDGIFKASTINFNKHDCDSTNNNIPTDFKKYSKLLYEYIYHFTDDIEKKKKSILLELDLNLPRDELNSIIKSFLDQYHHVKHKTPKNKTAIQKKLKKIVDIIFIYDGKLFNISNEDIITKLYYHYDKTMSKATFQKYLNIGIELIDNKGYLEIANGNKSIFDII